MMDMTLYDLHSVVRKRIGSFFLHVLLVRVAKAT
jgi:hypothetical protein